MKPNITESSRRILVAEDEPVISVLLSGDLRDQGYTIAGPFSSARDAILWLNNETPDLAIVDYMLRDGVCTKLLQLLRERDIPFIIFSGYARNPDEPSEFPDAPWFDKPASSDALLEALSSLSMRGRAGDDGNR